MSDRLLAGVVFIVRANVPVLPVTMALEFLLYVPVIVLIVSQQTLLQRSVADEYRGRILGALATTNALLALVGLGIAGVGVPVVGIVPLLDLAGALWVGAGFLALARLRAADPRPPKGSIPAHSAVARARSGPVIDELRPLLLEFALERSNYPSVGAVARVQGFGVRRFDDVAPNQANAGKKGLDQRSSLGAISFYCMLVDVPGVPLASLHSRSDSPNEDVWLGVADDSDGNKRRSARPNRESLTVVLLSEVALDDAGAPAGTEYLFGDVEEQLVARAGEPT